MPGGPWSRAKKHNSSLKEASHLLRQRPCSHSLIQECTRSLRHTHTPLREPGGRGEKLTCEGISHQMESIHLRLPRARHHNQPTAVAPLQPQPDPGVHAQSGPQEHALAPVCTSINNPRQSNTRKRHPRSQLERSTIPTRLQPTPRMPLPIIAPHVTACRARAHLVSAATTRRSAAARWSALA